MSLAKRRIAFIGGGAMAEALAGGLIAGGISAAQIRIAEPRPERCAQLRERLGVAAGADYADAVRDSDLIVLAVKPNVVPTALAALRAEDLDLTRPLWISIAAGVRLASLEAGLCAEARIIRAMPNTPALVGAGATAICGNARVAAADRSDALALFESVGIALEAEAEELLDAVTGLSGSGPAYVFLLLEALIDAGERAGLPRESAEQLASQTVYGAAKLARESDSGPAKLREQVSSPGGTTLAGLAALDAGGFRELLARAVEAATRRSAELGEVS
ncbi:MAG: pyrroline-5-carboxylate reductase [Deltaproteobacteria bacterium]|jgi:pyrroline-5-carboxylate reductase|nr:pyrroline-5-carboxylate reductase [Deltaproteobacteria bacterium]